MPNPWDSAPIIKPASIGKNPWDDAPIVKSASSPSAPPQEPSMTSQIGRQVGLAARAGIEGLASPVTGALDAVTEAANYFLSPKNQIPSSAAQLSQGLTQLGLPAPQTDIERGVNVAGNILAGGVATPAPIVRGAQELGAPPIRKSAESLMQTALKPTMKMAQKGDAQVAIQTMLEKNIPLSEKGMDALQTSIGNLNNKVTTAINQSKATVPVSDIEKAFTESMERYKGLPKEDLDLIRTQLNNFKTHPLVAGKAEIPIQDAQILKQGFQQSVADRYGQPGSGTDKAQKAIARALREGVSAKAPEVIPWNKEEQRLIRTLNVAQRRVIAEANKNPLGLAGLAVSNPKTFAAMMMDKNGTFRAFMARILYKAQNAAPAAAARTSGGLATAAMQPPAQDGMLPPPPSGIQQ